MAILAGSGGIIFFPELKDFEKSKPSGRPADLHPLARDEEALRREKFFGWRMFFWGRMFCPNSSRCGSLPDGLSWEAGKSRC